MALIYCELENLNKITPFELDLTLTFKLHVKFYNFHVETIPQMKKTKYI